MSLQSLLSIARSALMTHQRAMAVTAHNVANAQTPGYSRQRLEIAPAIPQWSPLGTIGRGVTDFGVTRARMSFYDTAYRRDASLLGGSGTLRGFLSQVESAFGEPSETGVAAALDGLFQAFGDLANDPSAPALRDLVRAAASRFVNQLHGLDAQVDAAATDGLQRMQADVTDANTLLDRIAELNVQILSANGRAPDLEDMRDLAIDQLATLIDVRVGRNVNGSVTLSAGAGILVDGRSAQHLEVRQPAGGPVAVGIVGSAADLAPAAGSLAGLLDLVNVKLPAVQSQLDAFAGSLVFEVNQLHRAGYTASGVTNVDFFDPTAVTAGTIDLSSAVSGSSANIAAGATPAPGDANVALQIAGLAGQGVSSLGGRSLRDFYFGIASGVGVELRSAREDEATYQALVDHDDMRRQSVSGVSVEEEMVLLVGQQQAYQAAARLIGVADEMIRDLLRIL
jgi:flagellar hook-associated protein 1 FlgK